MIQHLASATRASVTSKICYGRLVQNRASFRKSRALVLAGLSIVASFAACAESVEKKDFGEDFSDSGRRDATTVAPDGAVVLADGAIVAPEDATPADDATADTAAPDADTCTGAIAVLVGDDTSLKGAVKTRGAWTTQTLAGDAALSGPALVAFGTGFSGVIRSTGDALKTVSATGTAFGATARIGTASTRSTPSLATNGTALHVVFQDLAYKHVHATWTGAAFDTPADLGAQSFGAEPPAAAMVGNELVVAFGGDAAGPLVTQVRTGTTWAAVAPVTGTNVCATAGGGGVSRCGGAPGIVATGGATTDLLALHIDKATRLLTPSTRNATTKAVSAQGSLAAGTTSDDEVFLAKIGATKALAAFRGQNGLGYASVIDLAQSPPSFAAPVQLSATALASVPRIAAGVCGDDAVAVLVTTAGQARLVHLRGTTWGGEEAVGTVGASNRVAAVATRP